MEVFNHDVKALYNVVNRVIEEHYKSQSSSATGYNPHDIMRAKSYLAVIRRWREWIIDQPILDAPETHPKKFELEEAPVIAEVENEYTNTFMDLFVTYRNELINSQSARLASTLLAPDNGRLVLIEDKVGEFIKMTEETQPIDFPESSPQERMSGAGRTGTVVA